MASICHFVTPELKDRHQFCKVVAQRGQCVLRFRFIITTMLTVMAPSTILLWFCLTIWLKWYAPFAGDIKPNILIWLIKRKDTVRDLELFLLIFLILAVRIGPRHLASILENKIFCFLFFIKEQREINAVCHKNYP